MKKSAIIKIHLAYWGIFLFNNAIQAALAPLTIKDMQSYGIFTTALGLFTVVIFYLSYLNVFKLIKHKWWVISSAVSALGICTLVFFVKQELFMYFFRPFMLIITWSIYGALFRFFIDWIEKDRTQLQQSKQNLKSELALLRNQINPHFLFNSLHNIDTLITKDPQKASYSLLQLSDMLRYSFTEAEAEYTGLDKEIDYLKKYINLQNLRIINCELVEFNISVENPDVKIAPMLLIPFVENAYKHTTDKEKQHGIVINLREKSGVINFSVSNLHDPEKIISKDSTKGIGISNVSKRLQILYPDKHKLDISHDEKLFKISLEIDTTWQMR